MVVMTSPNGHFGVMVSEWLDSIVERQFQIETVSIHGGDDEIDHF